MKIKYIIPGLAILLALFLCGAYDPASGDKAITADWTRVSMTSPAINTMTTNTVRRVHVQGVAVLNPGLTGVASCTLLSRNTAGSTTNNHGTVEVAVAIAADFKMQLEGDINPNYIFWFTNSNTSGTGVTTINTTGFVQTGF